MTTRFHQPDRKSADMRPNSTEMPTIYLCTHLVGGKKPTVWHQGEVQAGTGFGFEEFKVYGTLRKVAEIWVSLGLSKATMASSCTAASGGPSTPSSPGSTLHWKRNGSLGQFRLAPSWAVLPPTKVTIRRKKRCNERGGGEH